MSVPSFLVIGAQKSGTTTLHWMLRQHPEVFTSRPKELHFFDLHYDRGLDWYFDQFHPGAGQSAAGETTGAYLVDPRSRERIVRDLPEVRLVAVLREPVSRAYSHYWMNRVKGRGPAESFEEAIAREPKRIAKGGMRLLRYSYLRRGQYIDDLRAYEQAVGRDRMRVFLMDDLLGDPVATMQGVFEFLGVDPAYAEKIQLKHRKRGESVERSRWRRKPRPYPAIDPATKAELRGYFRDRNLALAQWLGRDLPGWIDPE